MKRYSERSDGNPDEQPVYCGSRVRLFSGQAFIKILHSNGIPAGIQAALFSGEIF